MPAVESTAIRSIEYDALARELRVIFTDGRTYKYYDVPRGIYANFADAESTGAYFNRYIKDRYDFTQAE